MSFCRRKLKSPRKRRSDGTVKRNGFKGFSNGFGKRKRQLKITVDEATCRAIGGVFGGASGKQKVQPLGILRQRHVDRC